MSALRCGVAGLGNMGSGIAANLARAGLLSAAWDIASSAAERFDAAGRTIAFDAAALSDCDVVVMVVPGSEQITALFDAGALRPGAPGRIVLDLTTSMPEDTRAIAARARDLGYDYVDAGMTGGAAGAEAGKLTLMAGGTTEAIERLAPVFDVIAAKVFHLGPVGAGHTMKLIHNMICHTIFLATTEGCRAASKAGIELTDCVDVLNAGNARSFVSERRFPDHIVSGTFDGRSRMANLAKDLAMAHALFSQLGQSAPYVALTDTLLSAAIDSGLSEEDFTEFYRHYDGLAASTAQ